MTRQLFTFLAVLVFWAGIADAQSWSRYADGTGGTGCARGLDAKERCYYIIDNTDNSDSTQIQIERLADACFDPDTGSTGTATAEVAIRHCINTTAGANTCERVAVDVDGDGPVDNGILDGDPGVSSASQRMCIYDLGPGRYYIEVSTAPGAGETGVIEFRGHE